MKKKMFLIFAALLLTLSSLVSAAPTTKVVKENESYNFNENVVYLNGNPITINDTIIATPENREQLVEKYGLQKPSADAQLISIRIVQSESPKNQVDFQSQNEANPLGLFGYKLVKGQSQMVDGWSEIARGKYFCNRPTNQTCNNISVAVSANSSVSTEISTSFGVGFEDIISAEFGVSKNHTVGVSTTVNAAAPPIPGGKTFIAVGYPIYKSTFFQFYEKGLFSDTLLGTGSFLMPQPTSIAVTDWIQ